MYKYIKRFLDLILSFLLLVTLLPVLLLILLLLLFANKGNPFFFQPRPGKNEKIFNLIKFKSMNDKKDNFGNLLPDFRRLTQIGKFIRKTSLDELPQLFNVLKGDMSLVGPRPLLVEYLDLYSEHQKRRHEIRPGITGWAQVNGRNAISWQEKFEYDISYVDNLSFKLDAKIIFLTIKKVIISDGVNHTSFQTMEKFKREIQDGS